VIFKPGRGSDEVAANGSNRTTVVAAAEGIVDRWEP